MNESDIQKKVIVSKFVLFKFIFMPFGLTNAGQTFQHLMDILFHSFPFIFIYLDGILVFIHSHSEHLGHLETACTSILPNVILLNLRLNSWVIWSLPHCTSQLTHCKGWLGEIEQCNYNVSLLALLWSFRHLGVKM
jgi:hypothetical protein